MLQAACCAAMCAEMDHWRQQQAIQAAAAQAIWQLSLARTIKQAAGVIVSCREHAAFLISDGAAEQAWRICTCASFQMCHVVTALAVVMLLACSCLALDGSCLLGTICA